MTEEFPESLFIAYVDHSEMSDAWRQKTGSKTPAPFGLSFSEVGYSRESAEALLRYRLPFWAKEIPVHFKEYVKKP